MTSNEKPVILIADDSRVVRVSLKNILKNDCRLIEAEDGQQAWELLLETPDIQLIFSDLSMPRLDGRGLLQKIRNSEITRVRNIPFIVVTGNEEESGTRDELQDMGATEVVSKPFDPARIVSFVTTLASREESESYLLLSDEAEQTEFLTGALNQVDFLQSASRELSFAIRNKNELAIALLRIDQFDQLKSHYSDTAIEHILVTLAEIIRQHIHPDDVMAYFGDGLFAVLRPASNVIGTRYIGRRIIDDLTAKQFYLGESDEQISASVGISAPHIKPGIRLRELLLLAEGRLKAAMDLGGNRVVDKGNDTLTPVGILSDSAPNLAPETEASTELHHDGIRSSHLHISTDSSHSRLAQDFDRQELEDKIQKLQVHVESLTHEKKDLEAQADRLRKQSGESEQLRQRVFELESQQQHMQIKLNDLVSDNSALRKRAESVENDNQKLLAGDNERTTTLQQTNLFYEEENLRLQGQLDALSNRAQKAELAQRKSEQLVISLKDNIKLLRAQMEMMQNQLSEAKEQVLAAAEPMTGEPEASSLTADTDPINDTDTRIETRQDSNLLIDGFPSSRPQMEEELAPDVLNLFAAPSIPPARAVTPAPAPPTPPEKRIKPATADKPEKSSQSIPAYRQEPRIAVFKDRRPLSSFAIASLIMLVLLGVGGGYLYRYWQQEPLPGETAGVIDNPSPSAAAKLPAPPPPEAAATAPEPVGGSSAQNASEISRESAAADSRAAVPSVPVTAEPTQNTAVTQEARRQAELNLRQMAEAEFRQRLYQSSQGTDAVPLPAAGDGAPYDDATAAEAPVLTDADTAPVPADAQAPTAEGVEPGSSTGAEETAVPPQTGL